MLTSEPVSGELLRSALGDDASDAEVLVVSPALHDSPVRFWASDDDEAIERAQAVQEETVERLEEEDIDAAGDTGESDPLQAAEDALATFPADRVVIFSHPGDERAYREEELDEARERLGVPVIQSDVSR